MPGPARRKDRLAEFIRQEVANILLREMHDERLTLITVTRAEVSDDIQHARIYVRTLGTEAQGRTAMRALEKAAGKIQSEVGDRLQTRYTPRLQFFVDENVDRERRLRELMEQVKTELKPLPSDGEDEAAPVKGDGESE